MTEFLILVDEQGREIGKQEKLACHREQGQLHRAFSILLFDEQGRLLVQQRSAQKWLWPHFWSNSCCSHPHFGEPLEAATQRRLQQELGLGPIVLEQAYAFSYHATYERVGSEWEYCHVFLGCIQEIPTVNPLEISGLRYLSAAQLDQELAQQPEHFTPWFKQEWQTLKQQHATLLEDYLNP